MNDAANPENVLERQIGGMLAYWREQTETLDSEKVVMLDGERQNLLRAVQMGLMYPRSFEETADILSDAFPFIEQRGYWREWIPLLEKSLEDDYVWTPAARVMLMARLGQAYRLDQKLDRAIAIHLEAEQLAKSTNQNALIGRVLHDLLEDYFRSREYDNAIAAGKSAVSMLVRNDQFQPLLANCYKMLGVVFYEKGELEPAEEHLQLSVELWRKLGDSLFLARALNDLARVLLEFKKYTEAQNLLFEAANMLTPTLYELDKSLIQMTLGGLYASQKNWSKAEDAFHKANSPFLKQSVNLRRKAIINNNLGFILFHQGQYELAEEYLRQSVKLWEEAQDDLEAANTLSTLADSLVAQNNFEAALLLYNQVIEISRNFPQDARARSLLHQYRGVPQKIRDRQKNSQPL